MSLLAAPARESAAFERWTDRLNEYVQRQGALDALRLRSTSEAPWPHPDNPMLCYLRERTAEIAENEDVESAIEWLANQAWCEAAIAERARLARLLVDDE